jgi:hypothetical protein
MIDSDPQESPCGLFQSACHAHSLQCLADLEISIPVARSALTSTSIHFTYFGGLSAFVGSMKAGLVAAEDDMVTLFDWCLLQY